MTSLWKSRSVEVSCPIKKPTFCSRGTLRLLNSVSIATTELAEEFISSEELSITEELSISKDEVPSEEETAITELVDDELTIWLRDELVATDVTLALESEPSWLTQALNAKSGTQKIA